MIDHLGINCTDLPLLLGQVDEELSVPRDELPLARAEVQR